MRAVAFLLAAACAACGPSGDPLVIHYAFTNGSEQACLDDTGDPITSCGDVPMTCQAVGLLRVIDPDDSRKVYIDQCVLIPNGSPKHDLCAISQPFTNDGQFPTTRVEVQLAIYPHEIPGVMPGIKDDPVTHEPVCPTNIDFTTTGFAAPTNEIMPAFAGRAFADGFDGEVTIELGCSDPGLIDTDYCRNESALDVTASVLDFDQQVSVSPGMEADNLNVRVGEPKPVLDHWVFDVASTSELPLLDQTNPPKWGADNLSLDLIDFACIQVLEVGVRSVASLNCRPLTAPVPNAVDLTGFRVSTTTLNDVLGALGLTDLPNGGLVLGIVFGQNGLPVEGATVSDDALSDVEYLSADRLSVGGTATSTSGIFVSGISGSPDDAPFELAGVANHWRATAPTLIQSNDPIGGRVNFRLYVVVIQMDVGF